ncbi:MAG TPA: 3-deoxy-D-manno-octulosonic acid transferase [Thermoanaerobaculia bacterium]|nr:3-deoxy-D-manno-octulosonic acid transferase [Thermoanaerobaculia bacterium]
MLTIRRGLTESAAARLVWTLFAIGLLLSVLLFFRQQVGGDQLNLLARGWLLAAQGRFIPYGNPMSTGGANPGGLTSLLVGLPLLLWRDYRAPGLVVLAFHVLAFLILDRALARVLSARERVLFAVLYWLNPWRVYFSGFLWNPNFLFLFGAVHLATALAARRRASFWLSFLHFGSLMLAFQVHASFLLLVVASALLFLRGYFKVSWPGAVSGALVANVTLVPWIVATLRNPAISAPEHGFPGRGLVLVYPVLRGVLYLLRYASLSIAGKMGPFDFTMSLGVPADRWLRPLLFFAAEVIGPLTVLLPLGAWIWLRRRVRRRMGRLPPEASDRAWLYGYLLWTLLAALIVLALSPTTFMYWQGFLLVHAAVLPSVLWLGALSRTRLAPWVSRFTWAYAALEALVVLGMAFASPYYRCGGREPLRLALRYDHEMLHDLGIVEACPMPLNDPGGWWPDVLPKAPNPPPDSR